MFSSFFIHRPIFASVLSIVITLAGGIAVWTLPVAQYPEITPPTVQVSASYPGANSQVVADTVAAPIEQQVNGVEGMMYMSSQSHQRRLLHADRHLQAGRGPEHGPGAGAEPRGPGRSRILPDLVNRNGVSVKKKSPNVLMIVNLFSPRRQPRQPLPEQLRHHPVARRAGPARRASATSPTSASAITACALARSGARCPSRDITAERRGRRRLAAERPGGRRPDRPAAGRRRAGLPVHHDHAGPAHRRRPVRRHDPQDRRRRPPRPPARRRPASSSGPRATTRPARWTASRRSPCRSTSCPAPTP